MTGSFISRFLTRITFSGGTVKHGLNTVHLFDKHVVVLSVFVRIISICALNGSRDIPNIEPSKKDRHCNPVASVNSIRLTILTLTLILVLYKSHAISNTTHLHLSAEDCPKSSLAQPPELGVIDKEPIP